MRANVFVCVWGGGVREKERERKRGRQAGRQVGRQEER